MSKRLLLVDDEKQLLILIKAFLSYLDNTILVDTAETAHDALALFVIGKYGVVVVDIGLGDMNGLELCLKLKDMDKDVKVLALTGYYDPLFTQFDSSLAGFDAVFGKPQGYKAMFSYLESIGFLNKKA